MSELMQKSTLFLILLLVSVPVFSQGLDFRVMFYNVENFFDCKRDSSVNDADFTPDGAYHWTWKRFETKKNNIAKAIAAAGGLHGAALVGLCEIENREVLSSLVYGSPLKGAGYRIIHYDSPDSRGIDTALLYDPAVFSPLSSSPIRVSFSGEDAGQTTRDILYVKGMLGSKDTLHVFVCHAPSRRGGELASRHKRLRFASVLKTVCDSIMQSVPDAKIMVMGDFNDFPSSTSLSDVLGAETSWQKVENGKLYNMMAVLEKDGRGSYKYQGEWNMLDQIIVSCPLLDGAGLRINGGTQIFSAPFLLECDSRYFGDKPRRTYLGPRYLGGFSDHLPVYVDLTAE